MSPQELRTFPSIALLPDTNRAAEVNLFRFREYLNGFTASPQNYRLDQAAL